jgi:DNA-binding GntR family transcriptional regulator
MEVVVRQSFVDLTVNALRVAILRGEIAPGARLTEIDLAQKMEVSRASVRAALAILDGEGLVVRQPFASWRVNDISDTSIWEIYTLRGCLEGLAARLCAKGLNDAIRLELTGAYERLKRAEDDAQSSDRVEADLNFHRTIVRMADHSSLLRQYLALSNKFEWLYRWSEQHWPQRISLIEWHQPILQSILSGSPDLAEAAIRLHIENSMADDLRDFAEHLRKTAPPKDAALTKTQKQ